ncbi:MAG: ABC transporter substrate-binding protein, partial [Sphingobium sp.]
MTDDPARLSRRDLIAAAMGGGLVATAGGILLPEGSAEAQRRRHQQVQGRPRQGGRIRAACMSLSTADTLDPAKASLSSDYVRHFMLYNCLTELDRSLRARPSLAESITSDDQTLWTIHLRRGVTFHNGKGLTSADVVYSLLRHKEPATASKLAAIAEQFSAIRASGPLELTIQLTGPNADLPVMLAQSHFAIIPDGEKRFVSGNGTGPYKLVTFTPGVRTIGQRNRDYWKPGRPYLDEIELIGIPDEVSRVNALLSGDIHMALAVNPRSTGRITASARHLVRETPSALYTNVIMRQDQLPTSNPHFVAAIKYLMDRPLIKRALFRNYATIANDHPIPPFHPYYRKGLPQTSLDLDKARWHLKKAGIGQTRLPIYASPAAEGSVDMASILQEYGA